MGGERGATLVNARQHLCHLVNACAKSSPTEMWKSPRKCGNPNEKTLMHTYMFHTKSVEVAGSRREVVGKSTGRANNPGYSGSKRRKIGATRWPHDDHDHRPARRDRGHENNTSWAQVGKVGKGQNSQVGRKSGTTNTGRGWPQREKHQVETGKTGKTGKTPTFPSGVKKHKSSGKESPNTLTSPPQGIFKFITIVINTQSIYHH